MTGRDRFETGDTVAVVIPAFNEEGRIGRVVRRAAAYASELIVVDDCSEDRTGREAEEAGARVVRNCPNQGYIAAIKTGFETARSATVVTLDGDGELPPERIPELVRPILEGRADMVQGARAAIPRPSERVLTWLANRFAEAGDTGTGMRAIRTSLARELSIPGACICGTLALEVLSKGGRIVDVPISLERTDKPRSVAWYHFGQFFHLWASILKYLRSRARSSQTRQSWAR